MADVNKKRAVQEMTGLAGVDPRAQALNAGPDNIRAEIQSPQGESLAPAALKEGEIVFSIPAIVGAGNGNYDEGAEMIMALHERLKTIGEGLLKNNSLAGMNEE